MLNNFFFFFLLQKKKKKNYSLFFCSKTGTSGYKPFKGRFLGQSLTDANYNGDICLSNICLHLVNYKYFSCQKKNSIRLS